MKNKLNILQILVLLVVGLIGGAFMERNHIFGYSDNTPIIPNGTYKTTGLGAWSQITIKNNHFYTKTASANIVDNRFTTRNDGVLVLSLKNPGNISRSYQVEKISTGWKVISYINGKVDDTTSFIVYLNYKD